MQAQASPVTNRKLLLSRIEAESLQERDLLCPVCRLYSDASGHLRVKCPKCKGIHILNLAYFRSIKRAERYARGLSL